MMTQAETEVKNPDLVDNIPLSPPLEKSNILNGDGESDQTSNQVENITMGKDSPLSDIATSPVPFDLSLREVDGEVQTTIYNIEKLLDEQEKEAKQEKKETEKQNDLDRMDKAVEEVLKEIENIPETKLELKEEQQQQQQEEEQPVKQELPEQPEHPETSKQSEQPEEPEKSKQSEEQDIKLEEKGEEFKSKDELDNNNISEDIKNKDSYESSELSDLDENQSEAETDKMDFLDEIDTVHENDGPSNGLTDLQTLSQLTELARLKDMDSDFGDDEDDDEEIDHHHLVLNGEKSSANGDSRKRVLDDNTESASKKLKQGKLENGKKLEATPEETIELDKDASIKLEESEDKDEDKTDEKATGAVEQGDDDNGAEAEPEDEGDLNEHDNEEGDELQILNGEKKNESDVSVADKEDVQEEEEEEEDDDEEEDEHHQHEEQEEVEEEQEEIDLTLQRKLAIEEMIAIESNFAELRDKLFKDKLALLDRELQLCLEGSHPELSKIYGKINGFYQDGLRLANANLSYKLKCVDKENIATRTSIHQNFLRNLMDAKNLMITDTTSLWYKINKERNQFDQLVPDFTYSAIPSIPNVTVLLEDSLANGYIENASEAPIPKKILKQNTLIELVQQRNSINEQLGILNGLVEFHGFPSAVNAALDKDIPSELANELLLKRASDEEINEDLRAMGIST